ncbi:tetratricopeptide repeat protein [Anthocerotibacter panamensis]|uniref:tetratricopeptide repeat protein n=1 Tax=Anthocerotibacter panamensis TaxID=2857077 RepID=UPI001C4089E2|nr:tetratricopeptide repeat protein [Anthocerotibacter panamensis]
MIPEHEAAQLHLRTGQLLQQQGQIQEALISYQRALVSDPDAVDAYLALAQLLQTQGRLDEALQAFGRVHKLQPAALSAENYFQLGQALLDQGRLPLALEQFHQALTLRPTWAEVHTTLGVLLTRLGQFKEATQHHEQAIAFQPDLASAYWNLALTLQEQAKALQQQALDLQPGRLPVEEHFEQALKFTQQGQIDLAIRAYRRALSLRPSWAEAHCNLGNLLSMQGLLGEAIPCLRRAMALKPTLIEAYSNLGNALSRLGQGEEALQYHHQAIRLKGDWAELHYNLGDALLQQQRFDEALPCFQRALQLKPLLAEAHRGLGHVWAGQGQWERAIASHQQALSLKPDWVDGYRSLGKALAAAGRVEEAIQSYQKATALQPQSVQAYWELAFELWQHNRIDEAIRAYEQALALRPDLTDLHQNLCVLLRTQGRFAAARQAADRYWEVGHQHEVIRTGITRVKGYLESGLHTLALDYFQALEPQIYANPAQLTPAQIQLLYEDLLFSLPYLRDDLEANTQLCRLVGALYRERCLRSADAPAPRPVAGELRIGVLSKHFRRHSVGWCSYAILQELSRLTPHLYLYYTGRIAPDDYTERFKALTPHAFEHYPNRPIQASILYEQLQVDQLDVLIDLDSVMNPVHSALFAQHPAPICLSWLGCEAPYISAANYYLGDQHSHPTGVDAHYCEQLLRMPHSGCAVAGFARQPLDQEAIRLSLQLQPEQVVYLCVATGHKLNLDLMTSQMRILQQVPDSVLLHKGFGDTQAIQEGYRAACTAQGVDFQRLRFLQRNPMEEEHRAIYQLADVLLDTYPYNGGTHNLESLWFEVPLVTRVGEQGPSRLGYSFLQTLGIAEGVAWTWEEYVTWGVQLGQDPALRQAIRQQLQQSKQPDTLSPLWDPRRFAQDLYRMLTALLQQKCGQEE